MRVVCSVFVVRRLCLFLACLLAASSTNMLLLTNHFYFRCLCLGLMGYSLRSSHWRYTAWLEFDTNTFLPSLDLPPKAEELYFHESNSVGRAAQHLGNEELVNVVSSSEYRNVVNYWRKTLYDFLWHNSSFEHLFQKRGDPHKLGHIVTGRYHRDAHPHRHRLSDGKMTEIVGHYYSNLMT